MEARKNDNAGEKPHKKAGSTKEEQKRTSPETT